MSKDNTKGFATLVKEISQFATKAFSYQINDTSKSLRIETEHNKRYVQPLFSTIESFGGDSGSDANDAQIILISAVGATGKSTLAHELSCNLHCPIVDLGKAEVMAGNSLTGIIYKKLSPADGASFVQDLKSGCATMVIDGLDEGFQRTKTQGYFDFLDDVIGMTAPQGKSFILLGRTNAIELAYLHFDSKNIKTVTYQIEPFTIEQAYEFVRNILKEEPDVEVYGKPYKDLLDYIISSIGGFFKDHQDLKLNQYERFIGYAPVLLSIAEFLKKSKNNFKKALSDFEKNQLKGTSLIISIVEGILRRDKDLKILPQLIEESIKGRTPEFQQLAKEKAYTIEEQCARVLYRVLKKDYKLPVTGDEAFDHSYNQGIERWIDEHPFISENKIANSVFEGYILARLIGDKQYRAVVDEYIEKSTSISYMFFSIYGELHQNDTYLDLSVVSYLYSSLKALDNKKKYYTLDFTYDEADADELTGEKPCVLTFEGGEDCDLPKYQYKVMISKDAILPLHKDIGDVYIDVPINVELSSPCIVLSAPGYINCKSVVLMTDEIVLARRRAEDTFVIEAEDVTMIIGASYPTIICENDAKNSFRIITDGSLSFPLTDFQSCPSQKCAKLSQTEKDYYQKMRRTLIMFRSHSKGEFAKVQSKINNRISSKPEGKKVVEALLDKKIIYPKEKLYFIDKEKMNEHLGLKFDGLRTCIINEKVTLFLQSIK